MKRCPLLLLLAALFWTCRPPGHDALIFTHIYDPLGGAQGQANTDWLYGRVQLFRSLYPQHPLLMQQAKWDNIDTKIMADYRAGIAHDVVMTSYQLLAKHRLVGDLLDLDPILQWPQGRIEQFSWSPIWDGCVQEGQRLGVPLGTHTRLCVYNKELFRQAGLDPEQPPQTLQQFVEYAQRLTRDLDGDGRTDVWGAAFFLGPSRATLEITFAPLLWHFGGELWDAQSKQACFAGEAGIAAAAFLKDLLTVHKVVPAWCISGTYDDVIMRAFLNQRVAMAWGWGNYWTQALEAEGWIRGCYPPTSDGQAIRAGVFLTPTRQQAQFTNTWTVSLHRLSRWPEQGAQLIDLLLDPQALTLAPDSGLPSQKFMWEQPEYQTPYYKVWFEAVQKGRAMPPTGHYEELVGCVTAALQEILVRDADIRATLQRFQFDYNKRYAGE